ncbi:hypothetical protein [Psychroflexus sp. ALD_RP9]|uniref:hypothetical protein n=1 Tax=Psychroflexus sp. ALD_RP9 TaxID=2777186 RepID=UPI001A8F880E|nr:hypothetical protein [Psychroflexus sp. ALD_RP9]QSS97397.1 hypothetical protein IMZ30_01395 [Psychroflexus sp. ALD_RP9]
MKHFITLAFTIFCVCQIFSQENPYIKKHQAYFDMPRESLFIHLNKSKLIKEESLWLKGYALNRQTDKLHQNITNVNLSIYNSQGQLLNSKMLLANQGIFISQVKIDSTYLPGKYFIKAMTNYMNNFKEPDVFIESFEVINEIKTPELPKQKFRIKIKPESQNLVYGLSNNLGIRVESLNHVGLKTNIDLIENNKIIKQIKSSKNGLALLNFKPQKGNEYKVRATTNGGYSEEYFINQIESSGICMQLKKIKDYLFFNIEATKDINVEDLTLFIHQEEKFLSKKLKLKDLNKGLAFPTDKLFQGLNTILILKDDQPLLERIFFNTTSDVTKFKGNYTINQVKNTDSIQVNLEFIEKSELQLSASVLPKNQITYNYHNNILKNFRFRPYLTPDSYSLIKSLGHISKAELDIVMLMSESRYTKNISKYKAPELNYERQNGVKQTLNINQKLKPNDILLLGIGTQFNKEFTEYLNNRRKFEFQNRYPINSEVQKFAIITKQRNFKAPKLALKHTFIFQDNFDINFNKYVPEQKSMYSETNLSSSRIVSNFTNTNQLDEVLISTSKKREKKNKVKLTRGDKEDITEDEVKRFFKLSVYLRYKGFKVLDQQGTFSVQTFSQRSISGSNEVAIILDGARLTDTSFLSNVPLNQFESVTINKSGFGEGLFGANGVIKLESRKTAIYGDDKDQLFTNVEIKDGFAPIKKFKNPNYNFYNTQVFKKLGTIAWFPNLQVKSEKPSLKLKIVDTKLDSIIIFIEGITKGGQLHSYKIPIAISK